MVLNELSASCIEYHMLLQTNKKTFNKNIYNKKSKLRNWEVKHTMKLIMEGKTSDLLIPHCLGRLKI